MTPPDSTPPPASETPVYYLSQNPNTERCFSAEEPYVMLADHLAALTTANADREAMRKERDEASRIAQRKRDCHESASDAFSPACGQCIACLTYDLTTTLATIEYLTAKLKEADAGWQPIETAEKSGKSRLVWCPERKNIFAVTWDSYCGNWAFFGSRGTKLMEEPTHWMPIPQPPSTDVAMKGANQ